MADLSGLPPRPTPGARAALPPRPVPGAHPVPAPRPVAAADGGVPAARPMPAPRPVAAGGPLATRPVAAGGPPATRPPVVARSRPDPRPMRLGLAAGAVAALSVMVAGLVRFPVADPVTTADALAGTADTTTTVETKVQKRIRYVQLKPGQAAPPGAKVIDAAAPTPRVVVTRIQAPVVHRRVVTHTRQSGKP